MTSISMIIVVDENTKLWFMDVILLNDRKRPRERERERLED